MDGNRICANQGKRKASEGIQKDDRFKAEKLKIDAVELDAMNFKSRFENIKEHPGGHKAIGKERGFISNKVNKIKDEINLWKIISDSWLNQNKPVF